MTTLHKAINSLCGTMPGGICNLYDYSYHYYIKPNNIFSSVNEREERHQKGWDSDNGVKNKEEGVGEISLVRFLLFSNSRHWTSYLGCKRTEAGSEASGPRNLNFYKHTAAT